MRKKFKRLQLVLIGGFICLMTAGIGVEFSSAEITSSTSSSSVSRIFFLPYINGYRDTYWINSSDTIPDGRILTIYDTSKTFGAGSSDVVESHGYHIVGIETQRIGFSYRNLGYVTHISYEGTTSSYKLSDNYEISDAVPAPDGGFASVGNLIDEQPVFVTFDFRGNPVQQVQYGGSIVSLWKITTTADGGYIVIGRAVNTETTPEQGAFILLRLDKDGNKVWDKTFNISGGQLSDREIVEAQNRDILFAIGTTLTRLSPNGEILWTRQQRIQVPTVLLEASDGSIYLAGVKIDDSSYLALDPYASVTKFDSFGEIVWEREWDDHSGINDGIIDSGENLIFSLFQHENELLMKLSPSGNVIWSNRLTIPNNNSSTLYLDTVHLDSLGSILAVGSICHSPSSANCPLLTVRVPNNGTTIQGCESYYSPYSINETTPIDTIQDGTIAPAFNAYVPTEQIDTARMFYQESGFVTECASR